MGETAPHSAVYGVRGQDAGYVGTLNPRSCFVFGSRTGCYGWWFYTSGCRGLSYSVYYPTHLQLANPVSRIHSHACPEVGRVEVEMQQGGQHMTQCISELKYMEVSLVNNP